MSGPPNVGSGELSRIARKKSPSAPKWRNIEVTPCPRFRLAFWMKTFNMGAIYQLCRTILRTAFSGSYAVRSEAGLKRRVAIKPESGVRSGVSYPESAMHPRCVPARRCAHAENWLPAKISEALLLPNRSCQSAYYDPFPAQPRDRLLPNPDTYLRSPCCTFVSSKFLNCSSDRNTVWCRNEVKSRSRKVNVCKQPGRSVFGRLP